jgi:thiaminase
MRLHNYSSLHTQLATLTTATMLEHHLIGVNREQYLRTIHHPFLARAANGTLPKALVAQFLANDLQYLKIYKDISKQTLAIVRNAQSSTLPDPEDRQNSLTTWLEAAVENGSREEKLFADVAGEYSMDITLTDELKNDGLRRYETLLDDFKKEERSTFLPWLEGAVILWAMEKIYYEAWSWAREQDTQSSLRIYDKDEDGGAMRKVLIPNWANDDFLAFIKQLGRIINEGVRTAVKGDEDLQKEVERRSEAVYKVVLDAEEMFWPGVEG